MQNAPFTDQMQRQVSIPFPPKRIVSLVPSQTELLFDLGLEAEVVGITKFCIHPVNWFKSKTKIGGTKKLDLNLIRSLQPDLIIGNKEENEKDQIEQLMAEFNVWMSDIGDLNGALKMILEVGTIIGRFEKAQEIRADIETGFRQLKNSTEPLKVAYFIWRDPYMVAGTNTFINDVLERSGWINVVKAERYPQLTPEEILDCKPDRIFLSSEPYPFKDKHIAEFKQICPEAKVEIVDGEMFSWYGSRLLKTPGYLQTLFADEG